MASLASAPSGHDPASALPAPLPAAGPPACGPQDGQDWHPPALSSRWIEREVPFRAVAMDRVPWLQAKTLTYATLMRAGVKFPPIKVALLPGGGFEIRDGRHRWAAAQLAGLSSIWVKHAAAALRRPPRRFLGWTPMARLARELAALARPEGPPPWARAGAGLGQGSILPGGGRKARRGKARAA